MAKKKGKFHAIHIHPKAGTHYEVRHEPESEGKSEMAMSTGGGEDEKNEKLFAHGEREGLHKHLDALMDAHEGKAAASSHEEPDADDMPAIPEDHPMHRLKRKM